MTHTLSSFFSLRARIGAVTTGMLLVAGVLTYIFNIRAEAQIQSAIDEHIRALISAIDVAQSSLNSEEYLNDLIKNRKTDQFRRFNLEMSIADASYTIKDSSNDNLIGTKIDVPKKPQSNVATIVPEDLRDELVQNEGHVTHTFIFPVDTTGGRYYIVIKMSTQELSRTIQHTSTNRLLLILGVLVLGGATGLMLTWRFTRPITELSRAAKRVADGELAFEVPVHRRDEVGELAQMFNEMIRDLSEKRVLEERLNTAERSAVIGRLASGIAHEIRNPLNFINLSIDHVASHYQPADPTDQAQYAKLLGAVKREVGRLNLLVNDFLNYGRPSKLSPKSVGLANLIEEVVKIVENKARDQGIDLMVVNQSCSDEIRADAEQLKSCFSNIIINAIQAMPNGGSLRVVIEDSENGVQISIQDTGAGIPADKLDQIFEAYYSTKETGIGLGLAITRRVVELHQGSIRVESKVGVGTKFVVALPNTLKTGDLKGISSFLPELSSKMKGQKP